MADDLDGKTPPSTTGSALSTSQHSGSFKQLSERRARGSFTKPGVSPPNTTATTTTGSAPPPPAATGSNAAQTAAAVAAANAASAAAAAERAALEAAAAARAAELDEEDEEDDDSDGEDMLEEAEDSDQEKNSSSAAAEDSKEAREKKEAAAKAKEKLALAKQAAEKAKKEAEAAAAKAAEAAAGTTNTASPMKRPGHAVKKSMHQITQDRISNDDEVRGGAASAEDQTEFYLAVNRAHMAVMYKNDTSPLAVAAETAKTTAEAASAALAAANTAIANGDTPLTDPMILSAREAEAKIAARLAADELKKARDEDENTLYAWDNTFKGNLYLHVNKRDGSFEDLELAQGCLGFLQAIGCNHYEKSSIFSSHTREETHELKYGHRGMC